MITADELRNRLSDLCASIDFAEKTDARATVAHLRRELEIVELALAGLRKLHLNLNEHYND